MVFKIVSVKFRQSGWRTSGLAFLGSNRGKRGIVIDLKKEEGRDLFLEMLERADIVVDNFRAGVMERLGLGWDVLSARNPRVIHTSVTGYGPTGPYAHLPGFDPLFQFMHEDDVTGALALTLEKRPRGVFNVAGPQPVPLSIIIRETGRTNVPLPEILFHVALGRFGLPKLPSGALEHIKYPVTVDGSAFRAATGFEHAVDERAAMRAYRDAFPRPRA